MFTLNINLENQEMEKFISEKYGTDYKSLTNDFLKFIKSETHLNKLSKAFTELDEYKEGKQQLTSADDFLEELENAN